MLYKEKMESIESSNKLSSSMKEELMNIEETKVPKNSIKKTIYIMLFVITVCLGVFVLV